MLSSEAVQYAVSGVTSGSIYAMVGLCWSIVFLVTKIMNFSTGEFVMLGGMLTWVFLGGFGLSFPLAILLSILATVIIAIAIERLAIRPVRYPSEMTYMVSTIACASVIKGVILLCCGSETRSLKPFIDSAPLSVLGGVITPQAILVIASLFVLTISLTLFFNHTLIGKALKATAINPFGAQLVGINIIKVTTACFALAGAVGAMAGILIAPLTFTGYSIGLMTGLKGLVAAITGGWNIIGTVFAALILGLLEGFVAGYITTGWKDAVALLVMVVFLMYKSTSSSDRARQ